MKIFNALLLTTLIVLPASAQFSGYASATYGYDANPMANYAMIGDQLSQAYLSLGWEHDGDASVFAAHYTGGFVGFNGFADRNYYEHRLTAHYDLAWEAEAGDEDTAGTSETPDSTGRYLTLLAGVSARLDKAAFADFDNQGIHGGASYRIPLGASMYGRATDVLSSRSYLYVPEMSAMSNAFALELGTSGTVASFGGGLSYSYKSFYLSGYDTTRFDVTASAGAGHGKGKGVGGGSAGAAGQTKKILLQPTSRTTSQLSAFAFGAWEWEEGSLNVGLLYQFAASTASRYVAQQSNSSQLTDDLYNDAFNYSGPQVSVEYTRTLPWQLSLSTSLALQQRSYQVPALLLDGTATSSDRSDLRTAWDATISWPLPISASSSLDLSCSVSVVRNQSNDAYNDFSGSAISLGVGFSF